MTQTDRNQWWNLDRDVCKRKRKISMNLVRRSRATSKKTTSGLLPLLMTAVMLAMALTPLIDTRGALAGAGASTERPSKGSDAPIVIDITPKKTPIVIDMDPDYQNEDRDDSIDGPIDGDIDIFPT